MAKCRKRVFLHTCSALLGSRSVLACDLQVKEDTDGNEVVSRERYGEAFWRAHHEGWKRSD